jgi:hypothetical protein
MLYKRQLFFTVIIKSASSATGAGWGCGGPIGSGQGAVGRQMSSASADANQGLRRSKSDRGEVAPAASYIQRLLVKNGRNRGRLEAS